MNISRLIDIAVKVWPPKVVVIVNLFGEVNMPKDDNPPTGPIKTWSYDEFRESQRRRADDV